MEYNSIQLIISDIDGTLVKEQADGLPSIKTQTTIKKIAKNGIRLCLATGRSLPYVEPLFTYLPSNTLLILNGGSQIYDLNIKKYIWQKCIDSKSAQDITRLLIKHKVLRGLRTDIERYTEITPDIDFDKVTQIVTIPLQREKIAELEQELKHFQTIHFVETGTWEKNKDQKHLQINHIQATKQYAVYEVLKTLNIDRYYTFGIGDGHNDIPLLLACRVKVAMGNADERLKSIADYTTYTLENDGFSHAINKFVFANNQ